MLYGRDDERAVLDDLLAGAAGGRSGALVITGEPGIGKTALLEYAASASGARLLRATGAESEAELPFAGLQLLLRSALGSLDALPEVQAIALRGALGLAATGVPDRFLVGLAVLSLLSEVAGDGPLLCLVDDAQWLDKESAEALLFVARRLDAEGVVLLLGTRDAGRFTGLPTRLLSGLDAAASAALLADRGEDLPARLRYRLLAEAGGNPLALIELPTALGDTPPDGALPLTERMRAAFADQVHRLPGATRTLLRVAAADDTGDLAVVLRAAGALGASVHDLTPAERAGLVRVADDTLTFRHPLLRTAVYQDVPLGERLALHQALAGALTGPGDVDRRAWHLAAALTAPDEDVAAELERIAGLAGRRSGHAAAAAAYERAVRLTPDPATRVRRLILAAEAAGEAGAVDRALELAGQVTEPPADVAQRARLTQVVAFSRFWQGQEAQAYRLLVDLAGDLDAHEAVETLLEAAYIAWFTGQRELLDAVDRLTALRVPAEDRLLPMVRLLVAGLSVATGRAAEADAVDKTFGEAVRAAGDDYRELLFACAVQVVSGRDRQAQELVETLIARTRAAGLIAWLPNLLFVQAEAQLAHGQHRDAATTAEEALRIAVAAGLSQWPSQLSGVLAYLAAIGGDEERCRELADPILAVPGDPGLPRARWALAMLDLGHGRAADARDRLVELARVHDDYGVSVTRSAPDLVEAAVRAGSPAPAVAAAARYASWAGRTGQAWARALASRCQALLAPDDEAERHYQEALALHQADHRPFERARTALLYGEWLRRARRKAEASTHLRGARADFERLGATPWAARAATELTATGVGGAPDPAAPAGVAGVLTPQELRIARLAARGLSNRDIAAQLFLSPRTVGFHLYKAYPKLGVLSRGELAGLDLG